MNFVTQKGGGGEKVTHIFHRQKKENLDDSISTKRTDKPQLVCSPRW